MNTTYVVIFILCFASVMYVVAGKRASLLQKNHPKDVTKVRPLYYAWHTALWSSVPPLLILLTWSALEKYLPLPIFQAIEAGGYPITLAICLGVLAVGLGWSWQCLNSRYNARKSIEQLLTAILFGASTLSILTTIGIVLSVLFESIQFFNLVPVSEFFSLHWSPQTAIRAGQVGASGAFGAIPLFAGTLLITVIAMALALPVGLMSAIFLVEYATPQVRTIIKPLLEILAGIPTVVYGFIAVIWVAPYIKEIAMALGVQASSESALAAGLVMGVMLIPFICSLTDDALHAVPQSLRDGSYAMGATHSETIRRVVLPAALPGIVGGTLLAISRAIGETMIVVMAAGMSARLTANPLEAVTTVTVQIVTLLVGDQEFDSAKTLAAFALGLALFFVTLMLNIIALKIVQNYREQYE